MNIFLKKEDKPFYYKNTSKFFVLLLSTWKKLYVSGKLPTYPSPKPTFFPKWEVSVNVGLGEG